MTAPSKVPASATHRAHAGAGHRLRKYPVSDGAPVEVVESGPSLAARLTSLSLRLTFRPALSVLSHVPHWPWPFGMLDFVARALLPAPGTVALSAGRPRTTLTVVNTGDRPVQVGSHYHFAQANAALEFDRAAAHGQHLDVPAGTAVRFEPGIDREVTLVPLAGTRVVAGLTLPAPGPLDAPAGTTTTVQDGA